MGKTMDKRDRRRPRTPEDLDREYDFAGMKKAIESLEKRISELEKLVENPENN